MPARGSLGSLTQQPHAELAAAPAFRVVDITDDVEDAVRAAGVTDGLACVYSPVTGSAVRVQELETGLLEDFARLLERLVPGGDHGRRASLIAMLIGPAGEVVPVSGGRLALGEWQRVLLIAVGEDVEPRWLVHTIGT